jgi:hypothetical protein
MVWSIARVLKRSVSVACMHLADEEQAAGRAAAATSSVGLSFF